MNNQRLVTAVLVIVLVITKLEKSLASTYVNNLSLIRSCEAPIPPYMRDSPMKYAIEMYSKKGKNVVRGNVTVLDSAPTKDFLWGLKAKFKQNGRTKTVMDNTGFNCRYPLAYAILLAAKIPFDRKTCVLSKGLHKFDNIDVDKIDHAYSVIPVRSPGDNIWLVTVYSKTGTVMCLEIYGNIKFKA